MSKNWFQDMFDQAHAIHVNRYNYTDHSEIPEIIADHVASIGNKKDVTDLSLSDINDYLNERDLMDTLSSVHFHNNNLTGE
tara:strand:- start:654 stop:896 length:243 start_codon:yes stop_codon:yes gene_type:complete